jgi:tetratricopeptide (TPR) repeat protein
MMNYMLARSYYGMRKYEKTVSELEKLRHNYTLWDPSLSFWWILSDYYLGLAYEKTDQTDKAIETYERLLNLWKDADTDITEIDLARERLTYLRSAS